MKKLFVLISMLFLIGSVSFAQTEKTVKADKKSKIEAKSELKEDKADVKKSEIKKQDVKKPEVKKEDKADLSTDKQAATQKAADNQNGPEITFKETNHDFGNIEFKGNGSYEFVFVNTGNEPLILTQPKSSCGCTVPEWPRQPILPGESNVIKVTYKNTDRPGSFNKYVTVFSNALINKEVKLHIKGTILAEPTDAAPLKIESIGTPVNKEN
jgi:hypothetical protein